MEIKNLKREIKQSISPDDYRILKQALMHICRDKTNASSMRTARMHCLYFENNLEQPGEKRVEKFIIRYQGEDKDSIRLEKKSRKRELLLERSACISGLDCERILAGDLDSLSAAEDPLLFEFYGGLKSHKLKPKLLVDSTKETFVLGASACVSMESDFSTGLNVSDFLNEKHPTIARTGQILLEVQYEKYLPEIVSRLLAGPKGFKPAQLLPAHALNRI